MIGFTMAWFLWWIIFGSRFIIFGCIIAFYLFVCLFWIGKVLGRWYIKNKDSWFFDVPPKSKGNPKLKQNYQLWVTTASHPLAAPLKSKMTWLKGPKVDQLPNLFNTPKSVGTLEELLIMP